LIGWLLNVDIPAWVGSLRFLQEVLEQEGEGEGEEVQLSW
jgi:hypothetical protein